MQIEFLIYLLLASQVALFFVFLSSKNKSKENQLLQETRDLLLPRLISGKLSVEHLVEEGLGMVAEPRASYQDKI